MTTFANGESGLSVRTKINNVLQHTDGTAGELVINEAGADVDFRVESDTNANALFVDGATGNVGIGTSGPAAKLHVVGDAYIQSGTVFADAMTSYGGTSLGLNGGSSLIALTSGTERLRIDSAGNVGIGTSSPQSDLEIQSKTTGTDAVISLTAAGTRRYQIKALTSVGALAFVDESLASERLRIDASGNLLIGTSSSGASKLRISGLPTSSAGLSAGDVWNDGGTLKIA